jgi:hypothetical protein
VSGYGNGPATGSFTDGAGLSPGTYVYGVHVKDNAGNWSTERDSGWTPITVTVQQPLADLRGNTFDSQEPLTAGQTFSVTFTLDNNGSTAAAGFWVDFYLSADSTITTSDRYIGNYYVGGLAAGSCTLNLSKNLALPDRYDSFWNNDGTYYIGMIVDSTGAVAESNEANNRNRGDGYDRDPVLITGTGNQAPVLNDQALGPVAENSVAGTVVGGVVASDPDAGQSLTYSITGGNTGNAFAINAGTGVITVSNSAALNFEATPSFALTVRATDNGTPALSDTGTVTINLTNVNESPTDIVLSSNSVAENQPAGTTVGSFTTTDPDAGNTFTYSLVGGTGSTDNGSFTISGNSLKTAAVFDYEAKNSYSIRVRSTDQGGLWTEKQFTVIVANVNEQPTNIALSNSSVVENQPSGTVVGNLSTTDPDAGDTFVYTLVSGTGSTDNGSFTISGNTLKTASPFDYEAKNSYSIRVRSTDQGGTGLNYEKVFTISVTDVLDAQVAGQYVFYNNSALDGNTSGVSSQDDNAIAVGKQALMPGDTGSGANCTAYSKGLNGIMVDINGLANPGGLTLATIGNYFGFKVGTSGDPSGWASAPSPTAVDVRAVGGNSRVTIIWADNAIQKQWLQVTAKSGAATGLPDDEVFYFGNMPGDATGDGVTNGFDLLRVRQNYLLPPGGGRDDTADVTMDGNVNAFDLLAVRQNYLQSLPMISAPAAPTGGMAMTLASFEETTEPLAVQPVTMQLAPVVERVQVTAVPMPTGTAAAITASFSRPVSVAPAALEIVNPVGLRVELPTFRYEPVTRTASWTTTSLADGLYQGVIRSSSVLSDGASMARDSQFRFRLTRGIILEFQQDTNGDGIIDLLDLVAV